MFFSAVRMLLLAALLILDSAGAEPVNWKNSFPANLGVLIQKVTMSAKPVVVTVELYSSGRGIERMEGTGYVLSSTGAEIDIMLTAPIDLTGVNSEEKFLYSFSAVKPSGEVVHFPVRGAIYEEIRAEAVSITALDEKIKAATQELKREDRFAKSEDERLETLKTQALQMTGVDDLVELNTELDSLNDAPVLSDAELSRLNELYKVGSRSVADPITAESISDLNKQLFQITRLTTDVDRAERSKMSRRHTDVEGRIQMIRESLSVNSEEIAREVVRLRARRKELEQQLTGPVSVPPSATDGEF